VDTLRRSASSLLFLCAACGGCALAFGFAAADSRVEAILANPTVTGLLVIQTVRGGQAEARGIKPGDIIVRYAGESVSTLEQLLARIADHAKERRVTIQIVRDGKMRHVTVPSGPLGVRTARLAKGKPKWRRVPSSPYSPDLSGLSGETWMSFMLEGEHCGFERRIWNRTKGGFECGIRVAFAGHGFDDRYELTGRTGAKGPMSFESMRFVGGQKTITVELTRSGRQISGTRNGKRESIPVPTDVVPSYMVADMARTLPLRIHTRVNFHVLEESDLRIQPGHELICLKQERLNLNGREVSAWLFEDRQYNEPGNQYWIDGSRRLVKARWLANAMSVRSDKKTALSGIAPNVARFAR
jgi:hypothetical protein